MAVPSLVEGSDCWTLTAEEQQRKLRHRKNLTLGRRIQIATSEEKRGYSGGLKYCQRKDKIYM